MIEEQIKQAQQAQQAVAREQMEAAAAAEAAAAEAEVQPEEGDPPSPVHSSSAMIDELGFVTRRIATLQLEQEVLAQSVEENPGAAARLEEVVQELSALESALDQLGLQVGMDPSPAPSEYDDDESYDGWENEYRPDDSDPGPVRQLSSRRRPDRLRAARSRPSGPTDREAAWARAHAHAFGRASMKPDTG